MEPSDLHYQYGYLLISPFDPFDIFVEAAYYNISWTDETGNACTY